MQCYHFPRIQLRVFKAMIGAWITTLLYLPITHSEFSPWYHAAEGKNQVEQNGIFRESKFNDETYL